MKTRYRFKELSPTAKINAAINFVMAWNQSPCHNTIDSIEDGMADLECCDDYDGYPMEVPMYTIEGEDA